MIMLPLEHNDWNFMKIKTFCGHPLQIIDLASLDQM